MGKSSYSNMVRLIILLMIGLSCNAQFTVNYGLTYNDNAIDLIYNDVFVKDIDIQIDDTLHLLSDFPYYISSSALTDIVIGESRLNFDYICDVGTKIGNDYEINNTATTIEYYDLSVIVYYTAYGITKKLTEASTVIEISPRLNESLDTTDFVFLGNSLIDYGSTYFLPVVDTSLNYTVSRFNGTRGVPPYLHEGHPSQTYWYFVYSPSSPLWNGDSCNFEYYRNQNNISKIDYLFIELGINDFVANVHDTTYINTTIINLANLLIDCAIADDSVKNIIICLEPKSEAYTTTGYFSVGMEFYKLKYEYLFDQNYYLFKMHHYWKLLINEYSKFKYSNKVFVMPIGYNIDRQNGYTNDVLHPNESGNIQMGYSFSAYVNYLQSR